MEDLDLLGFIPLHNDGDKDELHSYNLMALSDICFAFLSGFSEWPPDYPAATVPTNTQATRRVVVRPMKTPTGQTQGRLRKLCMEYFTT